MDALGFAWPTTLVFWHWWIVAGLLLMLELLAPGIFFLWVGLAAGVTGAVVLFLPGLPWQLQALLFALLALAATFAGRRLWRPGRVPTDHPTLNRRAHRNVGRVVVLTTALEAGRGRVKVGDSAWSAVCDDDALALPVGTAMRVVDVRDGDLVIAPLEQAASEQETADPAV